MTNAASTRPLLIVEDDPALQKQIKWSLDRFESVTADDRVSALAQFRRHSPAVVTMDLGLPPDADFWRGPDRPFTSQLLYSGADLPADKALVD